jgi:hypothetical protein
LIEIGFTLPYKKEGACFMKNLIWKKLLMTMVVCFHVFIFSSSFYWKHKTFYQSGNEVVTPDNIGDDEYEDK